VCIKHVNYRSVIETPNVRRSLTITEENDQKVQHARAMFLALRERPVDMDYTSMTNLLLELGSILLNSNWDQPQTTVDSSKVILAVAKYVSDVGLKDDALVDQVQDYFIKNLPKLFEQYQRSQQPQQLQQPTQQQQQQTSIPYSR